MKEYFFETTKEGKLLQRDITEQVRLFGLKQTKKKLKKKCKDFRILKTIYKKGG